MLPLLHLHRGDINALGWALEPTAHRKVLVRLVWDVLVPLGDGAKDKQVVKHVVVEGSIVDRDMVNPSVRLDLEVEKADLLPGLKKTNR